MDEIFIASNSGRRQILNVSHQAEGQVGQEYSKQIHMSTAFPGTRLSSLRALADGLSSLHKNANAR